MTALLTRLLGGGGPLPDLRAAPGWETDVDGIIRVSTHLDRSASGVLQGALLDLVDDHYVFLDSPLSAVVSASYFLDGAGLGSDSSAPFDVMGTVAGAPNPLPDTLADGIHSIGVVTTLANGTTRNLLATFSVTVSEDPDPVPVGDAWMPANPRAALGIRLNSPRTGTKFKDYMDWIDPSPAAAYGYGKYHLVFTPSQDSHVSTPPIQWSHVLSNIKTALGTSSSSIWYENGRPMTTTSVITVMLLNVGETLAGQAAGSYPLANAFVDDLMDWLIANGWNATWPDGRPKVVLSFGWEPNGDWFRWSILTTQGAANYKAACERLYARMVARSAAAGTTMKVWWCTAPSVGGKIDKSIMKAAIPSCTKVIGMSIYNNDFGYTNLLTQAAKDAFYVSTVRLRLQRGYVRDYTGVGWLDVRDWAIEKKIAWSLNEGGNGDLANWSWDCVPFYTDLWNLWVTETAAKRFLFHAFTEEVDSIGDHRLRGNGADGSAAGSAFPLSAAYWLSKMDTNPSVP